MIELPDSYDEWKLREPPEWDNEDEAYDAKYVPDDPDGIIIQRADNEEDEDG